MKPEYAYAVFAVVMLVFTWVAVGVITERETQKYSPINLSLMEE